MIQLKPPNSLSWINTHQNPPQFSAQKHISCNNRAKTVVFEHRNSGKISGMELFRKIKVGIGCLGNWKQQELGKKVETEDVAGGQDVVDAAMAQAKINPHHLVIMVNGLVGSSSDWKFASDQFVKQYPDKIMVHRSRCNTATLTFDGVDKMGERLADEVLTVVSLRPGLEKISFVAHSLGGLVARYAIAILYEPMGKLDSPAKSNGFGAASLCHLGDNHRVECDGRIAGLEPMNFITVATPHLGSRGHKQLPFLCGVPFLERQASQTAHLIAGKSGKHLFLTDDDESRPPLLVRMASDSYELKFISSLGCFKRRVAYANANYDRILSHLDFFAFISNFQMKISVLILTKFKEVVGWSTSSIRRLHELPKANLLEKGDKYPHIVHIQHDTGVDARQKEASDVQMLVNDYEEKMIRGLNQVPWERVDVSFHKSRQRYIAHNTIQVKSYWLNSDGEDVIRHMIDNFLV